MPSIPAEELLYPPPLEAAAPRGAPRSPILWPVGVNHRLALVGTHCLWPCVSRGDPVSRAVNSGHVLQGRFVVPVLHDLGSPFPFLEVLLRLLMKRVICPKYYRRVRSPYASILES